MGPLLTSSWVMLTLLVHGPHCEWHCCRDQLHPPPSLHTELQRLWESQSLVEQENPPFQVTPAWSSYLPSSSSSFLIISYPRKVAAAPALLCPGPFLPLIYPQLQTHTASFLLISPPNVPQALQIHRVPSGSHLCHHHSRAPNLFPCTLPFFSSPELPASGLESSPISPTLSPPTCSRGPGTRASTTCSFFPSPLETSLQRPLPQEAAPCPLTPPPPALAAVPSLGHAGHR